MIISNYNEYQKKLEKVYILMNKGEENLNSEELVQIKILAEAIEVFEDTKLETMPIKNKASVKA